MLDQVKLKTTIQHVVTLLVQQDYAALEQLSKGVRLTAAELEAAIQEYGGTLILLPEVALDKVDVYEVERSDPQEWAVDVDLYTQEEGLSDLTLQLTLRESNAPLYKVEIDDLHVL